MRTTSVLVCVRLWLVSPWLLMVMLGAPAASAQEGGAAPVSRAKALELYAANCQICHGPNGVAPATMKQQSFAGRGTWKHGSRPRDVVTTITNGLPFTAMLPFKGRLQPNEIAALAALVRSFDKSLTPGYAGRGR